MDVSLDPAQRDAIELPHGRALLVLGEAGHGKTTVLLHRVARIWRTTGRSLRAAIIVPTEGLARLLQPALRRLGVDVEPMTFDRFAARQARRAFRRLPPESELTPPSVMRFKRSAQLRSALAARAGAEPGVIDDDPDAPRARGGRAHVTRGDLQHLYGDRVVVQEVARAARLPDHVVEAVLERNRVQFGETAEREHAHVTDRERLVAVDGRALDAGTATAHASTLDAEDYAVLFELDRLRAARRGARPTRMPEYDLIAIDEAQELAPLELALVGRSLAPGGTLVVAGDADQHTDETGTFDGWEAALRELAAPDAARVTLDIGYRCPPDVVALARAALDPAVPLPSALTIAPPELGRALHDFLAHDRRASIGVLCREPLVARRLAEQLRAVVPTRVVFDGRFLPRGPVQVTLVGEVKGLELDVVVVAGMAGWPSDAAGRRALYVATTRARHQVLLTS